MTGTPEPKRLGLFRSCPTCGYRTDGHSPVGTAGPIQPKAGDISICLQCGQLLIFELDMIGLRLRLPTTTELDQMRTNSTVEQLLDAWVTAFHRTPETRTA